MKPPKEPRLLPFRRQYPEVGAEIVLSSHEGEEFPVRLTHGYGPAHLFQVEGEGGSTGVIAVHPDGGWWWVRELTEPEPWRGDKHGEDRG